MDIVVWGVDWRDCRRYLCTDRCRRVSRVSTRVPRQRRISFHCIRRPLARYRLYEFFRSWLFSRATRCFGADTDNRAYFGHDRLFFVRHSRRLDRNADFAFCCFPAIRRISQTLVAGPDSRNYLSYLFCGLCDTRNRDSQSHQCGIRRNRGLFSGRYCGRCRGALRNMEGGMEYLPGTSILGCRARRREIRDSENDRGRES